MADETEQKKGKEERNGWASVALPKAHRTEGIDLQLLANISAVRNPQGSPDGTQIAFIWDVDDTSDIWLLAADGGGWPRRLTINQPVGGGDFCWSPDGVRIAFVAGGNIWIVPVAGGKAKQLTAHQWSDGSPRWSPDGTRIAFTSERDDCQNLGVVVVPHDMAQVEGSWAAALTRSTKDCDDPRWAWDSQTVYYESNDAADLHNNDIYAVSPDGTNVRRLTNADGSANGSPRPSPTSPELAFVSNRRSDANSDRFDSLWLMQPDGSDPQPLAEVGADVAMVTWSPDGQRIAFAAGGYSYQLYVVEKGGDGRWGEPCRLTETGVAEPGGWLGNRQIAYIYSASNRPLELWLYDLRSGETRQLTDALLPQMREYTLAASEEIFYTSFDGRQIEGLLTLPPNMEAGKKYPAIVFPHGGPTYRMPERWRRDRPLLASKGYVVLEPNFRGSKGFGMDFEDLNHNEWGIGDTQDCFYAADYLKQRDDVDGERIAVFGGSYGGYLALTSASQNDLPENVSPVDGKPRFRCAIDLFGDGDLITSWAMGDRLGRIDLERNMGLPSRTANRRFYEAGSAVFVAKNIQIPLLILHGEKDIRVHAQQSEELVEALKREGKTFEYKTYPDEGHGFIRRANMIDSYSRILRFLDWYLL